MRLTAPMRPASRAPFSSHESVFRSAIAPTHPNSPTQNTNCMNDWQDRDTGTSASKPRPLIRSHFEFDDSTAESQFNIRHLDVPFYSIQFV